MAFTHSSFLIFNISVHPICQLRIIGNAPSVAISASLHSRSNPSAAMADVSSTSAYSAKRESARPALYGSTFLLFVGDLGGGGWDSVETLEGAIGAVGSGGFVTVEVAECWFKKGVS